MKISFTILLSILLSLTAGAQTQTPVYLSQTIGASRGFYQYLPADYATTTKNYPVIIWIHGYGQIGQGNTADLPKVLEWGLPKIISEGGFPSSFTVNGIQHSFIVISPQFTGWPSGTNVNGILNYVMNNYRVDAERVYMMGISAGGGAIWDYASISVANSDKVAAMIPFCGTLAPTQTLAGRIAASRMPVWAFHNTNDGTVPVAHSRNWVNYINSYVPAFSPAAMLTEFPVQSNNAVIAHECWSLATLPSYKPQGINIYEWLLQYKRRTTIANVLPVARAGNDTTIVLPATVTLNGSTSTDADGIITAYRWRKISGPSHSFSDSTAAVTTLSNLSAGAYQFELRVTDNAGATATDNVSVNVYGASAPGTSQRVLIDVGAGVQTPSPTNGLYWNNVTDARPGIRVSNAITTLNIPSGLRLEVVNRLDGTYGPASNGMATGNTTGAVGDYPASATTDLALIHASATNGLWRISGMNTSKIYTIKFWGSRTNTTSLRTIEIKRADETTWKSYAATSNTNYNNAAVFVISGLTSMDFNIRAKYGSDFSAICVLDISYADAVTTEPPGPTPNVPPTANAGSNSIIQLPVNNVALNGCNSTDPEGAVLKFKWRKISGPAAYQIINDSICQAQITGLAEGVYQFELAVTDTGNLSAKDTVSIEVQPLSQPWPPVYTALCNDPYKIVILGSSTAYGTGASPIDSSWARKLARYISLQNSLSSVVNLGLPGYNSYNLLPTGTVNSASAFYPVDTTRNITRALQQKPHAIILNLPSNDVALDIPLAETKANFEMIVQKADSAKVPVWVTTTQPRNSLSPSEKLKQLELKEWIMQRFGNKGVDFWTDIADSNYNIATRYSVNDNVHVNNAGHHLFFTRVVEEKIWDSICLRKNAAPVAVAGNDVNITGSNATVQLNGNNSYDPEGSALSYNWAIVSGTGGSFNNSNIVNPIFSTNTVGLYRIVLRVTDDNQLSGTDTLLITVTAPNALPTANAGTDKIHNLPPNSLQLNGSGTDSDGTIVSYKWRKIYGPSLIFNNDAVANAIINNLVSGLYNLELTVTDNAGGIGKDSILITVNAPPVANAGTDIVITGTSANIQLNGNASTDPEGSALSYEWRIIAGTGATLSNVTTATPGFIANAEGNYSVELKVTDQYAASDLDTVNIVIAAANILPVANAGADRLIHLPTNNTVLSGSTSYDPDGTITAYKWRKISGPTMSFSNDAIANPTANGLTYGIYNFELAVTDNRGATAKDSMLLTVNSLPVANAGNNASITLPVNNITLSAAASTDADGTITAYSWQKISGPTATVANPTGIQTLVTFTTAGTYRFELTVTDNRSASAKTTIDITVLPVVTVTAKTLRVSLFGGTNPYNNPQWNNWNVVANLTSGKFNYEDGTASNINANITTYGLIADNGTNYAPAVTVCPQPVLRYTSANTSYRTLVFSGMTNTKTYNLEFYAARANTGNATVFQIGNRYDTISTDYNVNDFAKFNNIVPDNNGRITVVLSRIGTWHYLSGFIITENTTGASMMAARGESESAPASITDAEEDKINNNTELVLHPNPAQDIVYVDIPASIKDAYRINIVNMNGKILLQKSGKANGNFYTDKIDVRSLPKGTYLLTLSSKNTSISSTIIKL